MMKEKKAKTEAVIVDKRHRDEGRRKDSTKCPVSLVLKDHFNCKCVVVSYSIKARMNTRKSLHFLVGEKLCDTIKEYDEKGTFPSVPFTLEITYNEESQNGIIEISQESQKS